MRLRNGSGIHMSNYSSGLNEFEQLAMKLKRLTDEDPAKAIEEARTLPSQTQLGGILLDDLRAAILVNAGFDAKDKRAITDGLEVFRAMKIARPNDANLPYNLGNGLSALADLEPYAGPSWYLSTAEIRREARAHFRKSISLNNSAVSSVALTNFGNALWKAHRWAEAYDAYSAALKHDGTNAVALIGAAKVLMRCIQHRIGNRKVLMSVAARHLKLAQQHEYRIQELAGAGAYKDLEKLLEQNLGSCSAPDLSHGSEYERFVSSHRLALSPTIEGLDCSLKRWDSLQIHSITEPIAAQHGIPALFAMFNVMKSDFLAARYLAYQALSTKPPDSGSYADTLDYAVYGIGPSMLLLAQRACMDVLDKIGVATSEYFAIPDSEKVTFANRWFISGKNGQLLGWHPGLVGQNRTPNTAIIALAELSLDVRQGGALYEKKAYRNASTHRFTVLHDLGCHPSRESVHVEHCTIKDFQALLIESLQLARAALLYFVEMISIQESREDHTKMIPLDVPTHHSIRGEDMEESDAPDSIPDSSTAGV
jgi:tetratricopeptide (TPR) repeat protein